MTRRNFLEGVGGGALLASALPKLTRAARLSGETNEGPLLGRRPITVKPVLSYSLPKRKFQTSWRNWGGIQTQPDADLEIERIRSEWARLRRAADFPLEVLPLSRVERASDLASIADLTKADVFLVYAAGGWMDVLDEIARPAKPMIVFCRHKSGPVYLWYEIVSPRYLRQHTDRLTVNGVDEEDVVIDSLDELLWRLRSLCGLANTLGSRILAVGGPSAWAQPEGVVPKLAEEKWKFDIQTVSYDELGRLVGEARAERATVESARRAAEAYLKSPGVVLETQLAFVENAFLLETIFRRLMREADCRAMTINGCMGTIMPIAETSACLTLSLLNDAGYMVFCESDFVVIPSGVLLANISGKPVFLNDPTYPHDGIITLAHCTAPRKMDGKKLEPARIRTHFESDYGAAPKVQMRKGQVVTNIAPDFAAKRWVGLASEIIDAPDMDICRSQIDVRFGCDSRILAERMPGFHWMTAYGNYAREIGYAIKRVGIEWDLLG